MPLPCAVASKRRAEISKLPAPVIVPPAALRSMEASFRAWFSKVPRARAPGIGFAIEAAVLQFNKPRAARRAQRAMRLNLGVERSGGRQVCLEERLQVVDGHIHGLNVGVQHGVAIVGGVGGWLFLRDRRGLRGCVQRAAHRNARRATLQHGVDNGNARFRVAAAGCQPSRRSQNAAVPLVLAPAFQPPVASHSSLPAMRGCNSEPVHVP